MDNAYIEGLRKNVKRALKSAEEDLPHVTDSLRLR